MIYVGDKSVAVKRISPGDGHYFFGYYDLQPYNEKQTLHLTHKTSFRNKLQQKDDTAEIGFIEMKSGKYERLEVTRAWNFQQGAMLQWNPLKPNDEVIYNDFVDGSFCGVILNINTGKKRYIQKPVANVSRDGKYALSINMARLYDFRPGYGYAAISDAFYYKKHSDKDGIYLIDLQSNEARLVLSLQQIWDFSGKFFEKDEKLIINHITFNPGGTRFVMLVRNFPKQGERHDTAVITANRDGSNIYLLSDYGVQSHYWWLDDEHIVFYSDGKELDCAIGWGNNYILKDLTHEGKLMADGFFDIDNHMSFNPTNTLMITDSYPTDTGHQGLRLYDSQRNKCVDLGHFYSMPNVCTDVRCDLHPRWNRSGDGITFDSTHEAFRGIYKIDLGEGAVKGLFEQAL